MDNSILILPDCFFSFFGYDLSEVDGELILFLFRFTVFYLDELSTDVLFSLLTAGELELNYDLIVNVLFRVYLSVLSLPVLYSYIFKIQIKQII